MQEISNAYKAFWTGKEWQEVSTGDWQDVENGLGFRHLETGALIQAFPDRIPMAFWNDASNNAAITYPEIFPRMLTSSIATASIWSRRPSPSMHNWRELTNDVIRQLEAYILPDVGVDLIIPDRGVVTIYRGGSFVGSNIGDPSDAAIVRIPISLEIRSRVY